MVQNSLFLTSFRVAMATNINIIWTPLCWLIKDLQVWSKSFSATMASRNWMQDTGGLNNMVPPWYTPRVLGDWK